ncbi:acyl-CoA dehydrogenase family protein [Nocardioides sp. zg-DK7169]|uniref:acyl-CoA dehydrogenase family protein n=1 Tax=Nocardioides sp. zg-DK7169 TaxID=2736600 RepID=UPI0015544A32|nr:acyl-CoA dehydrogenase family protein [Nocardioides sp. zg-DK7169]NPC98622.1 acyl-CoA/acyl-ACP dehydrogenase [Nocardioides sp. zg-DK7169]
MDFNLDEDLATVAELASTVFAGKASTDRVREIETAPTRVDEELWAALAETGLLGIALPEEHGGAGMGPWALALLLEEQGRTVAPVPLWAAGVAALAIAEHGTEEQRKRLLPGFCEGASRLTVALEEYAGDPAAPACAATPGAGGADGSWTLTGTKAVVPSVQGAEAVLVSAATPQGPGLFLVPLDGAGVGIELSAVTSHDLAAELTLDGAVAEPVGTPGGTALADLLRLTRVALAAVQLGVAQGAMHLAASYLSEREQFGRPLGTFQAVQHQLADCWIDVDAMRVTLWQALSDLGDLAEATGPAGGGGDDAVRMLADRSAMVATWWRTQAGLDVVHRVQHLHGGIGVDVDYPVHRFFLWGKQLSTTLGGSSAALGDLGALLPTR